MRVYHKICLEITNAPSAYSILTIASYHKFKVAILINNSSSSQEPEYACLNKINHSLFSAKALPILITPSLL